MYECKFSVQREIKGEVVTIELTEDEIRSISCFHDVYGDDCRIWEELQRDYGAKNFALFEDLMGDIFCSYRKNLGYGCDETFSWTEAFREHLDKIEALRLKE